MARPDRTSPKPPHTPPGGLEGAFGGEATGFRIGELVALPPVRTVVRMADLDDAHLRGQLLATFVVTDEVALALRGLLGAIAAGDGRGAFLRGSYGSGKSHFLAVLGLLCASQEARTAFERSLPPTEEGLRRALARAGARRLLIVRISLVGHGEEETLEEVVWQACSRALREEAGRGLAESAAGGDGADSLTDLVELVHRRYGTAVEAFLAERGLPDAAALASPGGLRHLEELLDRLNAPFHLRFNRTAALRGMRAIMAERGFDGLFLAIDELSEFLRSKTDGRRFAEDIRFLQFLGEACEGLPAWIVATVQEHIETTGEIPAETFNKIRDRYSLRFHLTGAHVKELIARRLVKKKLGAESFLHQLYRRLHGALGGLPFGEDEFVALYPVHPATVELLDDVRPLFSQHRGAVDFIHYRLAGDPRRGIPSLLEAPAEALLGADAIFDHFRERLAEDVATAPLIDQAYAYFQRELPRLARDAEERALLERIVKILLIGAAAPARRAFSGRELSHLLLYRLTDIDPEANAAYVIELLEHLVRAGAYVTRRGGGDAEARYALDLEADAALLVRRRIDQIQATIYDTDGRLISHLAPWLIEPHLPLADWADRPHREFSLLWQRTRRPGVLHFAVEDSLDAAVVRGWQTALASGELEFVFIVLPPFGAARRQEEGLALLRDGLSDPAARRAALCWVPADLAETGRLPELKRALAHALLEGQLAEDATPAGKRLRDHLTGLLPEQKRLAAEILREAYFTGRIIDATGCEVLLPAETGYIPFDRMLERAGHAVLAARYPQHAEIAPAVELLTAGSLQRTIDQLLREGEVSRAGADAAVSQAIAGFLAPMRLVKRTPGGYRVDVDPGGNPLVAAFFAAMDSSEETGRTPLGDVWLSLRLGPFGISRPAFEVLALTLCHAGAITPFSADGRRAPLAQVTAYSLWKSVAAVGAGELVAEELQRLLPEAEFIPPRLRKVPLTFTLQRELWDYLTELKKREEDRVAGVLGSLAAAADFEALRAAGLPEIRAEVERVGAALGEIKVSYTSQEGIERFLAAYRADPHFDSRLKRLQQLEVFLAGDLDRLLHVHRYANDPRLGPALERLARGPLAGGEDADPGTGLMQPDPSLHELARRQEEFAARTKDPFRVQELLFDRAAAERFFKEFGAWQTAYVAAYRQAHSAALSSARAAPYRRLAEGPAYKALTALETVEILAVPQGRRAIDRQLAAAERRACDRATAEALRVRPVCECGFPHSGAGPLETPVPTPGELQAQIEQALLAALAELRRPENAEKVRAFLAALREAGQERSLGPVRELLALDPAAPGALEQAVARIDRASTTLLRRAVLGEQPIAVRDVDQLREALIGRVFTRDRLLEAIEAWLGPPRGEPYIRIVGVEAGEGDAGRATGEDLTGRLPTPAGPPVGMADPVTTRDGSLEAPERRSLVQLLGSLDNPAARSEAEASLAAGQPASPTAQALVRLLLAVDGSLRALAGLPRPASANGEAGMDPTTVEAALRAHGLTPLRARQLEGLALAAGIEPHLPLRLRPAAIDAAWRGVADSLGGAPAGEVTTLTDLVQVLWPLWRHRARPAGTALVWLDGWRWDLWQTLRPRLATGLFEVADAGLAWAPLPTTTETVVARLAELGTVEVSTVDDDPRPLLAAPAVAELAAGFLLPAGRARNPDRPFCRIARFGFADTKLHTTKEDLVPLFDEIAATADRLLLPFLRALPRGTCVLAFADHGFAVHPAFDPRHKYHMPRYTHGGGSLDEVVVPWEVWQL